MKQGAQVMGSDIGKRTHALLDLNRLPLLEHRKEKLDDFVRRVHEVAATLDQSTKAILLAALIEDAQAPKRNLLDARVRSFATYKPKAPCRHLS
jgi:hypothetical protein